MLNAGLVHDGLVAMTGVGGRRGRALVCGGAECVLAGGAAEEIDMRVAAAGAGAEALWNRLRGCVVVASTGLVCACHTTSFGARVRVPHDEFWGSCARATRRVLWLVCACHTTSFAAMPPLDS